MEQSIELKNENSRLKQRLLDLQARLERSEKENLQLRDRVRRLKLLCNHSEDSSSSQESAACNLLSPSTYEYSQASLMRILEEMGIPAEVIEKVSVQIELEYQRWVKEWRLRGRGDMRRDVLSTALSYCFDCMMRSFIEKDTESPSLLASFLPVALPEPCLPYYSDGFKDFVDLLSQPAYASFYTQLKQFCINMWISLYNTPTSPGGGFSNPGGSFGNAGSDFTNPSSGESGGKKSAWEVQRDFSSALEKSLKTACGQDVTCEVENEDIKEGVEQVLANLLGGCVLHHMVRDSPQVGAVLNKHMLVLQFLQPKHLDVSESASSSAASGVEYVSNPLFATAVQQLQAIACCRSPKHMLTCLSKATQVLFSVLGEAHSSADDFLPLFIFCTLKTQVLYLNVITDYINKYRNPKELVMG